MKPKVIQVFELPTRGKIPRYWVKFYPILICKVTGFEFDGITTVTYDELSAWQDGTKFIEERWDAT